MLVRAVLIVVCVAAAAVLIGRRDDARTCTHARTALFTGVLHGRVGATTIRRVRERCHDSDEVAVAAVGLSRIDPAGAAALARVAVRRAPDSFAGWAATAIALRARDPQGAVRAARRARALNPQWTPPR